MTVALDAVVDTNANPSEESQIAHGATSAAGKRQIDICRRIIVGSSPCCVRLLFGNTGFGIRRKSSRFTVTVANRDSAFANEKAKRNFRYYILQCDNNVCILQFDWEDALLRYCVHGPRSVDVTNGSLFNACLSELKKLPLNGKTLACISDLVAVRKS